MLSNWPLQNARLGIYCTSICKIIWVMSWNFPQIERHVAGPGNCARCVVSGGLEGAENG
jgi:hypothetical protein